jgi:hypothetical protein
LKEIAAASPPSFTLFPYKMTGDTFTKDHDISPSNNVTEECKFMFKPHLPIQSNMINNDQPESPIQLPPGSRPHTE